MMKRMATLSDLPVQDIVALRILPHLTLLEVWHARLVCKYMHRAVDFYIQCCLKEVDVSIPSEWSCNDSCSGGLSYILFNCLKIQSLSIKVGTSPAAADPLHLNSICIDRLFKSLTAQSVPNLQQLKLHGVGRTIPLSNRGTLDNIIQVSSSLRCLHLINIEGLDYLLKELLVNTDSLEEFVCTDTQISGSFFDAITKQTSLRILKLNNCLKNLKPNEFLQITKLHELQFLQFEFLDCLTEDIILTVVECCPKLKQLELMNCLLNLSWRCMDYFQRKKIAIKTSSKLPQFKPSIDNI